ncbi:MAG: host specificity protein, partial [Pseudomonadota bacterium]|nr:host specificity protein [Pseudomonadota bacterium]
APQQIDLAQNARGLARHYRIGPAGRAHDDPSYSHAVEAFDGIGLRPYAPCHLRARRTGAGDLDLSWIRRTRIDGDSWVSPDVPLGEAQEQYLIRVRDSGEAVLREVTVAAPSWTYGAAQQAGDGVAAPYFIDVAQVSERFGAGFFKRIVING